MKRFYRVYVGRKYKGSLLANSLKDANIRAEKIFKQKNITIGAETYPLPINRVFKHIGKKKGSMLY